jgi:hypothetical protein
VTWICAALASASATIVRMPRPTGTSNARGGTASGATRARISAIAGNARARTSGGAAKTSATSTP